MMSRVRGDDMTFNIHRHFCPYRLTGAILMAALFFLGACSDDTNEPTTGFTGTWDATYQIDNGQVQTSQWTLYETAGNISGTVRLQRGQWYTESAVSGTLESNGALAMSFTPVDSLNTTDINGVVTTTRDYMSGLIIFVETDPISGKTTLTSWGYEAFKQ
jgi:hypothetical protein